MANTTVYAPKEIANSYIKLVHTGLSGGGAGLRADPEETVVDLKCTGLGVGVGFPDSVKSGVDFARRRDFGRVVDVEEATLSKIAVSFDDRLHHCQLSSFRF